MQMLTFRPRSGASETQGRRDTMEDAHKHIDNCLDYDDLKDITKAFSSYHTVSFYGVYDGHGGTKTALLLEQILHETIFKNDEFSKGNITESLVSGFLSTDKTVLETMLKEGCFDGATAVVGLILNETLHVANIGDSEACLVRVKPDGTLETVDLTVPHKASDPIEKERIEKLGGHVFFGRVFGALAVSRAFGDAKFKSPKTSQDFVTAEPHTFSVPLTQEHKFIIFACDGLWDVLNHMQAAEIVYKLKLEGKSPEDASRELVKEALRKRTEDNVTVIVVYLNWGEEASEESGSDEERSDENTEEKTEVHNDESTTPNPQDQSGDKMDIQTEGEEKQSNNEQQQNQQQDEHVETGSEQPSQETTDSNNRESEGGEVGAGK